MRILGAAVLAGALLSAGGCAGSQSRSALPVQPEQSAHRSARAAGLQYGAYEWQIEDFVKRYNAGTLWALLDAKHVNVVLAGFDDKYIDKCSTPQGAAAMNAIIANAQLHGVRIVLLLGNPSWIPPSGVASLKQILHDLRRVNFAGLDLDLEPNELEGVPVVKAFKELVTSMHAYEGASQWPVSIDVNHFYVDAAAVKQYSYCLMCGLESAGVKRVNLMTYVSDPKTVVADVAPILARYPSVTFTISQSVEAKSVLPVWDSYWSDGFVVFYKDMQWLNAELAAHANYSGITIESLYYLERIKP
jgi:hypothetical protein